MDSVLLSILSPLAAAALTGIGIAYRDYRKDKSVELQRRWDREDREFKAASVAAELQAHARKVEMATNAQTGQLLAAVADNTKVSTDAFTEANGYNQKIAQLHERMAGIEVILKRISAKLESD